MRGSAIAFLLAASCAFGSAGFSEQGQPEVWGVAMGQAMLRNCSPREDAEPLCAEIRGGPLSENARGFLDKVQEIGRGLLGLIF